MFHLTKLKIVLYIIGLTFDFFSNIFAYKFRIAAAIVGSIMQKQ